MNKIFSMLLFILMSNFIFISNVQAEVETFEGHGDFLWTKGESIEESKETAKIEALRYISQQVYTEIKNRQQNKDSTLDYDEIEGKTESIIRIMNEEYKLIEEKEGFIIRAIIIAEVDIDEIEQLLKQRDD